MKKLLYAISIAGTAFLMSCSSKTNENKEEQMPAADTSKGVTVMNQDSMSGAIVYVCPCGGCPEIREANPGKCSKCEMDLVEEKK